MYWITTSIISLFLTFSAYTYIFSASTIEGIKELGLPDFLRVELAILKIAAALLLLIPNIPTNVREWAYSGVALFLLTAFIAHIVHRDSIVILFILVMLFMVLALSRYSMPY